MRSKLFPNNLLNLNGRDVLIQPIAIVSYSRKKSFSATILFFYLAQT